MKMRYSAELATGLLFIGMVGMANADPVLNFTDYTTSFSYNTQNIGWEFNVTSAIQVTALSWADLEFDGLSESHMVGIWDNAGNLLASVNIEAGTSAILNGVWRTVDIADITIGPGNGYIVGGHSNGYDYFAGQAILTVNSAITFVDATYSDITASFLRPGNRSSAENGFFGPSFDVTSAPVPEPTTMLLFGTGIAGLAAAGRRRK